jgi:rhodanese-related sulfurtransferase
MWQKLFGFRPSPFSTQVQTITPQELHQRMQRGEPLEIVDVRSPEEYRQDGHIRGSQLLPLGELNQKRPNLPQDRSIICVCRSGNRSHFACEALAGQGFHNVTNLVGGMLAWRRAGLPFE